MYTEAIKLTDQDKRDKLLKHAAKTRSIAGRKAMIEGAKHLEVYLLFRQTLTRMLVVKPSKWSP